MSESSNFELKKLQIAPYAAAHDSWISWAEKRKYARQRNKCVPGGDETMIDCLLYSDTWTILISTVIFLLSNFSKPRIKSSKS